MSLEDRFPYSSAHAPRLLFLLVLLTVICTSSIVCGASRPSLYLGAGVDPSIGMLGRYTDLGYGGTVGVYFAPFASSPELQFAPTFSYDHIANSVSGRGGYSFARAGLEVKLITDDQPSSRPYLILGGGIARVSVSANCGFPPYRGKAKHSTNVYGSGGIGFEFRAHRALGVRTQAELVDILDTLFGDYRFFRITLGIRI